MKDKKTKKTSIERNYTEEFKKSKCSTKGSPSKEDYTRDQEDRQRNPSFLVKNGPTFIQDEKKLDCDERKAKLSSSVKLVKESSVGLYDDQKTRKKRHPQRKKRTKSEQKSRRLRWRKKQDLDVQEGKRLLGKNGNSSESRFYQSKEISTMEKYSIGYLKDLDRKEEEKRERKEALKREKLEKKIQRGRRMAFQRFRSPYTSHKCCGRYSLFEITKGLVDFPVKVKVNEDNARVTGVATCSSPWCVECGISRMAQRAHRIDCYINDILDESPPLFRLENGRSVVYSRIWFFTPTVLRHWDLRHQVLQTRRGWKGIKNYNDYRRKNGEYTYETARAVDGTFKPWLEDIYHCHYHTIIVFSDHIDEAEAKRRLVDPWCDTLSDATSVSAQDLKPVVNQQGFDEGSIGLYLAKAGGLGAELAGTSATKKGRRDKGWSFSDLIDKAALYEREEPGIYTKIYREFLKDIKGTNCVTFSRGWPKYEEEEKVEKPCVEITINTYWLARVLREQSIITILLYGAYISNENWIIRDFQRIMRAGSDDDCDSLCLEIGFTPHGLCKSWRYLWEEWLRLAKSKLDLSFLSFGPQNVNPRNSLVRI